MNEKITQELLKQKLKYNRKTGELIHINSIGSANEGRVAGNLSDTGYIRNKN